MAGWRARVADLLASSADQPARFRDNRWHPVSKSLETGFFWALWIAPGGLGSLKFRFWEQSVGQQLAFERGEFRNCLLRSAVDNFAIEDGFAFEKEADHKRAATL